MADVVIVRWPEEGEQGSRLVDGGTAVLYLVDRDADPPQTVSCLEDWVRVPGDDRDLQARLAGLGRRAAVHDSPPHIDAHGLLHYRGHRLPLPPGEARLADVLLDRFGEVVTDRELHDALLGPTTPPSTPLRTQVMRLRARLRAIDLVVQRIRRRGYLLESR